MIDNYDSFTYNLVQYLGELGAEVEVFRNDAADLEELLSRSPAGLVISPGPGRPRTLSGWRGTSSASRSRSSAASFLIF